MTLPERARPATLRRRRQATIINLAIEDPEAQRLLGCFLTILAEQGPSRGRSCRPIRASARTC